jgi:putative cardiolipin synthase
MIRARTGARARAAWLVAALLAAALPGCAPIRTDVPAAPSFAFDRPADTTLGRAHAAEQAKHAGLSAFRLINNGSSALATRGVLADLAERSIDLQVYIYDEDDIGAFVAERLLAAANRGVRVRILVDDIQLGLKDETLAHLDAHPNIEVRVYNPVTDRARWSRTLKIFFNLERFGHRMHNKVFAVDGQAAILGGRNVSNFYFEAEGESNFRDVDVLASGPIVHDVLQQFDSYWNSPVVVPVAAFGAAPSPGSIDELPPELARFVDREFGPFAEYARRKDEIRARILEWGEGFVWAKALAVAEPPVRREAGAAKPSAAVARTLAIQRQATHREFVMETAYFVPGERGVQVLGELARRGVRVQILTNSLGTTDVPAVHAGYARYREALVAAGVQLHEYRPDATRPAPREARMRLGSSQSALHAKVIVHDRRVVWIGSANFDPRSRSVNTETGLLIDSRALAERLLESMERDFAADHSWRLALEPEAEGAAPRLAWIGLQDGALVHRREEPPVGFKRRFSVFFWSLIPIEELL